MTQQNIQNLLERKKKWMTSKQIAACLKISSGSVAACLKKLFKQGFVLRKTLNPGGGLFSGAGCYPYYWRIK
ncbi:hypothetical protein LCGC14_0509270 [marine sediment metagenome]|uniref:Uncharacterized protein n=1 Tax=marine sediment metagenome TaxID=412755 RepID=A0A0F9UN81_9ZZZZ|nr:hypothetical protein [bacterium]